MIVRYTGEKDGWFTPQKEYDVLEILIVEMKLIEFRVIGNDGRTPVCVDAGQFIIIDGSIPSNWHIQKGDGFYEFSPLKWQGLGFWEQFFDGEPDAIKVFNEELEKIKMTAKHK